MSKLERIWERIRAGRHTAVIGELPQDLPSTSGFYAVRVACGGAPRALGPLLEAQKRAEEVIGVPQPMFDQAAERVRLGLRRRLLGEMPEALPGSAIVESLNRLKRISEGEGRWAVVLDQVDSADEDTVLLLREMITRRSWLQLPLLLSFSSAAASAPPDSAVAALLTALGATEGADGIQVIEADAAEEGASRGALPQALRGMSAEMVQVLRAGALIGSGFEADLVAALLGKDALHVLDLLQAAADLGLMLTDNGDGRFDLPDDLAQGLRASMLPSLAIAWHRRLAELLSQTAVPMEPLPPSGSSSVPVTGPIDAAAPASSTSVRERESAASAPTGDKPSRRSMRTYLRETAAAELAQGDAARASEVTNAAAADGGGVPPSLGAAARPEASAPTPMSLEPSAPAIRLGAAPLHWPYADLFPPSPPRPEAASVQTADASVSGATPAPITDSPSGSITIGAGRRRPRTDPPRPVETPPQASSESTRMRVPPELLRTKPPAPAGPTDAASAESPFRKVEGAGNEARAAGHLVAAGEIENGAARFLAASREAAAVGAHVQAVHHAREALSLIESLPAAPRRRRLRVLALCELGRVQWQAAGPGGKFTLPSALESLTIARSLIEADDPIELRTNVSTLLASVCYDLGDLRSLDRALHELTEASRALLESGDAVGAARLLNDQAAVYVRFGDPVRASHLLEESRRVFERLAPNDPSAALELAETDHLLARLPLHVAARPGREADAITMGKSHAQAAEQTYRRLGAARELTRVWETLGRLEIRAGRIERALENLTGALQAQRDLGDVIGLARTTAALSEALSASGQHAAALGLLRESISLNLEKGSPIGLAYNRRTLEQLAQRVGQTRERGQIMGALDDALKSLVAAEESLGRIHLPGEPG